MDAKSIMQVFSDTAYVRTGGSPEELKTANYLLSRLEQWGVSGTLEAFDVDMADILEAEFTVDGKMAKTQSLSLNPTKISGTCGRLMCCLKYEQEAYEDAARRMPKNESFVQTPDGPGNVSNVNLLKEQVTVRLDSQPDSPRCYHNCEVCVLRNGKGSRDGIQVPEERPARRVVEDELDEFPAVVSDFRFTAPEPTAPAAGEQKEGGRSSRRRRRGGRGGEERSAEKKPAEQAQKTEGSDKPRSSRRGGKKPEGTASAPQPPKAQAADAPAKKPRHRGGRRHSKRGGAGGSGKTEA